MQLGMTPLCEDDHLWIDDDAELVAPRCATEAVAVLIQTCPTLPGERERELICRPLADWVKHNGTCSAHESRHHLRTVWL
jgi:hypothetical protein